MANPAFATAELERKFDRSRYHGTVIWSWQQALMLAGLTRQLARTDLPETAHAALEKARTELLARMASTDAVRGSELWSWSQANGVYRVEFFGQRPGDETESNAAQLWSTVSLARGVNSTAQLWLSARCDGGSASWPAWRSSSAR